ncbi:hypothetical protein BDZ97DRAFT_321930 [Flammula alnicola]|nr:hypothetical protein BDZ97DRAFT_321930 [Flammula alnicola]
MARVFAYLLAIVTVSASIYQVEAAPIESRQIGGLACNIARLKTVSGLAATTKAVNKIASGARSDATVSSATTAAQSGLQSASAGIKTIAGALLTGQNAPADARNQVAEGLTSAQTALDGINSTDPVVTSLVNAAKQKLQGTINAGSDVVSQCGGSSAAASGSSNSTVSTTASVNGASAANGATPGAAGVVAKRQIGNLSCNIARLQTVSRLAASSKAVSAVTTAAAGRVVISQRETCIKYFPTNH